MRVRVFIVVLLPLIFPRVGAAADGGRDLLDSVRVTEAPGPAVDITKRRFYEPLRQGLRTAAGPWPRYDAKIEQPRLADLQQWLLAHDGELRTWPPRFPDDTEAAKVVAEWQRFDRELGDDTALFLSDAKTMILRATLALFGHNIDEEGASEKGLAFLKQAKERFPQSAVPWMLSGLLQLRFGGKWLADGAADLRAALKLSDAATYGASLHGGLANYFLFCGAFHQAALEYAAALTACNQTDCLDGEQQQGIAGGVAASFGRDVKQKASPLVSSQGGKVSAPLLGFSFQAPPKWLANEGGGGEYDPASASQSINIPAAPTPEGLQHALSVFAWISPGSDRNRGPVEFLEKFRASPEMTSFRKMKPLVDNSALGTWYAFESKRGVGKGDTIVGYLVRSKHLRPRAWTRALHEAAAAKEGLPCPNGPGGGGGPGCGEAGGTGLFYQSRALPRLMAPIDLVFIYSASKGTRAYAEQSLRAIFGSLKVTTRAGSELVR